MGENNGKFYKDKFFYVVLVLCIGSWGWATFLGLANLSALNGHCAEAKAETSALKSEMIGRDETMLKEITQEFKEINNALSELKTDVKYLRKNKEAR